MMLGLELIALPLLAASFTAMQFGWLVNSAKI
jgi:hypothetical protein